MNLGRWGHPARKDLREKWGELEGRAKTDLQDYRGHPDLLALRECQDQPE